MEKIFYCSNTRKGYKWTLENSDTVFSDSLEKEGGMLCQMFKPTKLRQHSQAWMNKFFRGCRYGWRSRFDFIHYSREGRVRMIERLYLLLNKWRMWVSYSCSDGECVSISVKVLLCFVVTSEYGKVDWFWFVILKIGKRGIQYWTTYRLLSVLLVFFYFLFFFCAVSFLYMY